MAQLGCRLVFIFLIKIFICSGKKEGKLSYRDIGKITKNQAYIHIYIYIYTGAALTLFEWGWV